MKRLLISAIACLLGSMAHAQSVSNELLAQITQHCVVREATTQMMVEGRDKGIAKEQVLSQLQPISGASTVEERATFSRLNDVYGMPRIGIKTMSAHRFFGCLWHAMDNKEPLFGPGLEAGLLNCQSAASSSEEHGRCVRAAQRANFSR